MRYAIGVDIGGTNIKYAIISEDGEVTQFNKIKTETVDSIPTLCEILKSTLELDGNIVGVGIGAPNLNVKTGLIENPPNIKHWGTVDLLGPFKEEFSYDVFTQNDANIAAVGEKVFGAAKNYENFITITLGTGLGSGIFINNSLFTGGFGNASEAGHIAVTPPNTGRFCGCGGRGHLETYASVRGIKLTTKEITTKDLSFHEIVDLYQKQDPEIIEVFKQTAETLGHGLASIGTLFEPQAFILTGGIAVVGNNFLKQVEDSYNKYVFTPMKNVTTFHISPVATSEGSILGAAALVFHNNNKS